MYNKEHILKFVALHLTYKCSNRCPYCYIGNENRDEQPNLERIKKIIHKLKSANIEEILLVGGDICTYEYLIDVVKLIRSLDMRVSMLSNTLDFGEDIGYYADNVRDFGATILGRNDSEHDSEANNTGAYRQLVCNMRKINEFGRKVSVALSIHTYNYDKLFDIVDNLVVNEGIDISEIVIQRIVPFGRACDNNNYVLGDNYVPQIFEQIQHIKDKYGFRIYFEEPFPMCVVPEKYRYLQANHCLWGFEKASLDFKGNFSRCSADTRFFLGNILDICDIQKFWNENEILMDFRGNTWMPEKCQSCEMVDKCRCGCPLSVKTLKDHDCDVLVKNPLIDYEVKKLIEGNTLSFATADADGNPNVIAVSCAKVASGGEVVITDNYMKKTIENLSVNRNVCMCVWNNEWKGIKVIGEAACFRDGKWMDFVRGIDENKGMPVKGAVVVKVSEVIDLK